ncbi:MAG: hypothetical protein K8R99_10790 [Actinomycetia bacterium]|nr:hypothetical protein [Actinomycetes bacterium]
MTLRVQNRRTVPLVAVMSCALLVFVGMVSFGVDTSCTNAWSCTSSSCPPCRVVSIATVGGLALGALLGAGVVYSPWPRRGRAAIYIVAMLATALLTLVVAQSWGAPRV